MMLLLFFVAVIGIEIFLYLKMQSRSVVEKSEYRSSPTPAPTLFQSPYDTSSIQTPFNLLAFNQIKDMFRQQGSKNITSQIKGFVYEASLSKDGDIIIQLESQMPNTKGKLVWIVYRKKTKALITVDDRENKQTPGMISSLKRGDLITIDETNDFTKDYPDSIISVLIKKL